MDSCVRSCRKRVSMSSGRKIFFWISVTERGEKWQKCRWTILFMYIYTYVYSCMGSDENWKEDCGMRKKEKQESSAGLWLAYTKGSVRGGSRECIWNYTKELKSRQGFGRSAVNATGMRLRRMKGKCICEAIQWDRESPMDLRVTTLWFFLFEFSFAKPSIHLEFLTDFLLWS